jgi:ABC-type sugar transport system ATPase subunit
MVAIVIALERVKSGLRLLVLDEVTASLPRNQAEPYLDQVMAIAASGVGVLMVTHRLAELQGRATSVTLLRDGAVAYRAKAGQIDERRIVSEMVGAGSGAAGAPPEGGRLGVLVKLWQAREAGTKPKTVDGPALRIEGLAGVRLQGLSMSVAPGEIVGVAGLGEAGVTELPLILSGALASKGGRIVVDGKPLPARARPRDMIRAGLAVLPADRLHAGGIAPLSVAENTLLPDFARYWHHPQRERSVLRKLVADFDIRPPNPMVLFGRLSGGNQQKTILAKWLLLRPSVLVLDDPTNGVDPHARRKIFELLRDAAAEGVAVVMFSTEPEQFASICSRVVILRGGKAAKELAGDELTPQTISQWCYG